MILFLLQRTNFSPLAEKALFHCTSIVSHLWSEKVAVWRGVWPRLVVESRRFAFVVLPSFRVLEAKRSFYDLANDNATGRFRKVVFFSLPGDWLRLPETQRPRKDSPGVAGCLFPFPYLLNTQLFSTFWGQLYVCKR